MAENKTKPTDQTVENFLDKNTDAKTLKECFTLINMMEKAVGEPPKMWGPGIIGFGEYHYKYDSGRQDEICLTGFSPRKGNLSLYVLNGFPGQAGLLAKLGKHKAGKGCLYIKRLDDVNLDALEQLVKESVDFLKKKYSK